MPTNDEYNGWTNYETWLVNLWMTNEQGSSEYFTEQAREAKDEYEAGEALKNSFSEFYDTPTTGILCDLITASLSRVDWMEIAKHLREE